MSVPIPGNLIRRDRDLMLETTDNGRKGAMEFFFFILCVCFFLSFFFLFVFSADICHLSFLGTDPEGHTSSVQSPE